MRDKEGNFICYAFQDMDAELFSLFDKIRICKAEYQRMYGYPYENICFTRKELQELYLKEYKCQKVLEINMEKNEKEYFETYKFVQKRLKEVYFSAFWDSLK